MKTPADARQAIAALKGKTDCVKLNEDTRGDFFTAIAREAHAAGMTVISHSLNAIDSATWGIDGVEHMTGVGISAVREAAGQSPRSGSAVADSPRRRLRSIHDCFPLARPTYPGEIRAPNHRPPPGLEG